MINFRKINLTIKAKLLIIFFILATVPISIVGTFSYLQARRTISKLTTESSIKTTKQLSDDIQSVFKETESFLEIAGNEKVKNLLNGGSTAEDIDAIYNLFQVYRNTYKYNKNILDIYIIGKNQTVISEKSGINRLNQEEFESNAIYNALSKKSGEIQILPNYTSKYISYKYIGNVISLGTTIIDEKTSEILGVIVVDFDTSIIEGICDKVRIGKSGRFYIVDKRNILVFNPPKEYVDHVSDYRWYKIFDKKTGSIIQKINGIDYLIVNDIPDNLASGWKIFGEVPLNEIMQDAYKIRSFTIATVEICILLSVGLFAFLTDRITRPIRNLKKQMLAAENGNLEVKVKVPGNDELSDLGRSFNEMIKKIKLLLENNIKEHEKLKKAELNIMQAQINPHFLYNSLDAIVWMAEGDDKDKIIDIVTALSVFFRISLSKGAEIISIGREIEHCRNYLIIQKMRYGDLLSYSINIDASIINNRIVKIILQPIVENAIYHGIKNKKDGGNISILGYEADNQVILTVEDTGIGIAEDKLLEISQKLLEENSDNTDENMCDGFGLYNVNDRLKLYFGNDYGLSLESIYEQGTKVTIKIPIMR